MRTAFVCKPRTLTATEIKNGGLLLKACDEFGIKNKFLQDAILLVAFKESGFTAKVEACYNTTPNTRIRFIFGKRVEMYTDAQLNELKKDCVKFFDQVYGSKWDRLFNFRTENDNPGDGFKYRGRAFNGVTFKVQYRNLGKKLGVDLVAKPELLEQPEWSAKAAALYFSEVFKNYDAIIKQKFGVSAKDVKNLDTAVKMIYNINAGLKFDINNLIANDVTDGWKITQCAVKNKINEQVRSGSGSGGGGTENKNIILPLLAGVFFLAVMNRKWIKKNLPKNLKKFL